MMRTWVSIRSFQSTTGEIPRRLGCVHAHFASRGTSEQCGPKPPAAGAGRFLMSSLSMGPGGGGGRFSLAADEGAFEFLRGKTRGEGVLYKPGRRPNWSSAGLLLLRGRSSSSDAAKVSATL